MPANPLDPILTAIDERLSRAQACFWIGAIALAARVLFVFLDSKGAGEIFGDAAQYHAYAVNLLGNGRYEDFLGDRLFRMPGYPLFLAGVYFLFGLSVSAVQAVQCLLSALACAALYDAARRLYGPRWGLAAGLVSAVYFGFLDSCPRLCSESLSTSLVCFILWLAFCAGSRAPAAASALMALLLSALCFVRPDFAVFAVILFLGLPRLTQGRYGRRHTLLWIPIALALALPWTLRNYRAFGRFVPGATQGEAGLYMGLALPLEKLGDIPAAKGTPPKMPELEQKAFYLREFRVLRAQTPAWKILRAYLFNILSVFYPFLPAYDWTYMLLLPFWLWGALLWKGRPEVRLPTLCALSYLSLHVFMGGPVSRYREPISGPLILLAAAGAGSLHRRWGKAFWRWSAAYAMLNVLVWALAPKVRLLVVYGRASLFGGSF
ncbi:MAG: glycosyltransferase family 39 protein [Elusimicrobiota bacterium]